MTRKKPQKVRLLVLNSKGGVAKTTTCAELIAHWAAPKKRGGLGKRVLAVDMDAQGNLSKMLLGSIPDTDDMTVSDILLDEDLDTTDALRCPHKDWGNVHLLPANKTLEGIYNELEETGSWATKLKEIVDDIEHNFDIVIFDTGPNTTYLTRMAMMASNCILCPVDESAYSEDGTGTVTGLIEFMKKKNRYICLDFKVILAAQNKVNSKSMANTKESLAEEFGDDFLDLKIPHCTKVPEGQKMPKRSPAAHIVGKGHELYKGYRKLAEYYI